MGGSTEAEIEFGTWDEGGGSLLQLFNRLMKDEQRTKRRPMMFSRRQSFMVGGHRK